MEPEIRTMPGEDGWWVSEVPAVPGCVSQGRTPDEAIANVREALEACLAVRADLLRMHGENQGDRHARP
jgi:predicted RNase H-like HicB family nuclease